MHRPAIVNIDADFLRRVYTGEDPPGFAQFVGEAAASPDFVVMAFRPAALGIVEVRASNYHLGKVAYGHYLSGDWDLLRIGLDIARRAGCRHFLYPIAHDQPNRAQLERVLTGRYQFAPYEHVFIRRIY